MHTATSLGEDDSKANRYTGLYPFPVPEICEAYILDRGKQWQTTPNNLPRMQHSRVIPVA
jgi:hypothetical protein